MTLHVTRRPRVGRRAVAQDAVQPAKEFPRDHGRDVVHRQARALGPAQDRQHPRWPAWCQEHAQLTVMSADGNSRHDARLLDGLAGAQPGRKVGRLIEGELDDMTVGLPGAAGRPGRRRTRSPRKSRTRPGWALGQDDMRQTCQPPNKAGLDTGHSQPGADIGASRLAAEVRQSIPARRGS